MFENKEKKVKEFLNKETKSYKEDKEYVFNKVKNELDLQLEKPKRTFNLKPVFALLTTIVVCVAGYVGYLLLGQGEHYGDLYQYKNVNMLNLGDDDYCLAYNYQLSNTEINILNENARLNIKTNKYKSAYLLNKNNKELILLIDNFDNIYEYELSVSKSFNDIVKQYEKEYEIFLEKNFLNSNNSGLLFEINPNHIEFYTIDNKDVKSIFIDY